MNIKPGLVECIYKQHIVLTNNTYPAVVRVMNKANAIKKSIILEHPKKWVTQYIDSKG